MIITMDTLAENLRTRETRIKEKYFFREIITMLDGRLLGRSHSDQSGITVFFLCHLFSTSACFCYFGGGDGSHNLLLAIFISM